MNMKKLLLGIGVLLLAAMMAFFFILRKPHYDYLNVLPQDARALLRVNLSSMASELDLDSREAIQLLQNWQIDKSGVDFNLPSYGFVSREGFFGLVFPIAKDGQFKRFLEQNHREVENQRGYHWITLESWLACFDKSKCLIMGPASSGEMGPLRNQMHALMSQKEHKVEALSQLDRMSGSAAFFAHLDVVPQIYSSFISNLLPKDVDLNEVSLCSSLKVDSKALKLETKLLSENRQILDNFKTLNDMARPIQGDMIHFCPESPFFFATANVEGEKLLEILRKDKTIRRTMVGLNMVVDADMMIQSVKGDVAVTMPRFNLQKPEVFFCGNLQKQDFLQNVDSWKTGLAQSFGVEFRVLKDHDFSLGYGDKSGYFGVRKNKLYVATSQDVADEAFHSASNAYLEQNLSLIQDSKLYVTMDVRQALQALGPIAFTQEGQTQALEILNDLERIDLYSSDLSGFTLKVDTKQEIKDIISSLLFK